MASSEHAIRRVVVAGSGITGWSAAAALKRRLPELQVTIVPVETPPNALADRIVSTLPSIIEFHADLGLSPADTIVRAGSCFRMGVEFSGWADDRPPYVHAYGEYGKAFGSVPFHHHWVRSARHGPAHNFDSHCPAAAAARASRFVPAHDDPQSPVSGIGFGLNLNPPLYRELLKAYALHLGASERKCDILDISLRSEDGFIASLRLSDGSALEADLFVDCTGPEGRLRSALDQRFEDWSQWLPCDRVMMGEAAPLADLPTCDRVTATAAGWLWQAPTLQRTSFGAVYGSRWAKDDEAQQWLRSAGAVAVGDVIQLRQGRRSQPWFRNCVALGDAAVSVEPLEWTNLHLAHSGIDRMVAMMPAKDCSPLELWDYNRQAAAEADRVRDFLALHYLTASRPEPFWKDTAAAEPPQSLRHSLSLFQERGRLPYYEEETFSRDSWLAILFGNGVIPRRTDPLIDVIPPERSAEAMARIRDMIEAVIPSLPTQTAYLRSIARQVAR